MKLPLIFTLVFALLAGSYTTPVEDTKTTIPPAVVMADAIAANDAPQADTNPEIAPSEHKAEAIDASDDFTAPKAEPDVIVNAINASDAVPKAPEKAKTDAVDASDDFTAPKATPEVIVNAISANEPKDDKITLEKAKEIALAHAGLAGKKAYDLETELDKERGKAIFEVSFENGKFDYEYEIDATTGEILTIDKEWDD